MPANKRQQIYINTRGLFSKKWQHVHKIYKSKDYNLYEGLYCDANFYPVAGGKVPFRMRRQKRKFTAYTIKVILKVFKLKRNEQIWHGKF